ncbi:MAG: ABC transporter substrate binding protein [Ghiorsea sp.]|nr:ABC transporter substrate binding protein [Ghiorsea sp.]
MKYTLLFLAFCMLPNVVQAKECVYINSYHAGYAWSDAIEQVVRQGLQGQCHLTVFYMDTKRHTSEVYGQQKALEAKQLITRIQPDVVLVSDDNASKYLVKPYYKNSAIPFVFCGINWAAEVYGYPYDNATGMIEVSPIQAVLRAARETLGDVKDVLFIGVKGVATDNKEFVWLKKIYAHEDVRVQAIFVHDVETWKQAYLAGQSADMIVLNNVAGIANWNPQELQRFVQQHAQTLTVTTYDFMTPYTMFAMTKVAQEQGDWMVQLAKHVLQGKTLRRIPVVANRRWETFVNLNLLNQAHIQLPADILFKAVRVLP